MYKIVLSAMLLLWFCINSSFKPVENPQTEDIKPTMVLIKGGKFEMGYKEERDKKSMYPAELKAANLHQVEVSSFYMSRTKIPKSDYKVFYSEMGYKGGSGVQNFYAASDWYRAVEYCNWRSKKDGFKPCYTITNKDPKTFCKIDVVCDFKANGYRLPTEAEWEYVIRGGEKNLGTKTGLLLGFRCPGTWASKNEPRPNSLGIVGLDCNLPEWCWDNFAEFSGEPQKNPTGAKYSETRVLRGGEQPFEARNQLVSWYRDSMKPCWIDYARDNIGQVSTMYIPSFRVVRTTIDKQ